MANNTCPFCHYQNREENRYCTQCGSKLLEAKKNGAYLILMNGGNYEAKFRIEEGLNTIGKEGENLIFIDDDQISKKHAQISSKNTEYWIEDLNSKNGVYINGKKIEQAQQLFNGSILKIGSKILKFEISKSG